MDEFRSLLDELDRLLADLETLRQRGAKIDEKKEDVHAEVYRKLKEEYDGKIQEAQEKLFPVRKLVDEKKGALEASKTLLTTEMEEIAKRIEELELRRYIGEFGDDESFNRRLTEESEGRQRIQEQLDTLDKLLVEGAERLQAVDAVAISVTEPASEPKTHVPKSHEPEAPEPDGADQDAPEPDAPVTEPAASDAASPVEAPAEAGMVEDAAPKDDPVAGDAPAADSPGPEKPEADETDRMFPEEMIPDTQPMIAPPDVILDGAKPDPDAKPKKSPAPLEETADVRHSDDLASTALASSAAPDPDFPFLGGTFSGLDRADEAESTGKAIVAPPGISIEVSVGGKTDVHPIPGFPFTIGRSEKNLLTLSKDRVSRYHAQILNENDKYWLEDLGSANGTRVNGKRIQRVEIRPGDRISIGPVEMVLQTGD